MTEPTRLLVVDDRHENRYYLLALLEASGYVITLAHDGAEALLKARADPPDLIISDLLMPVMDGYTLLRNWKADDRLREIPFIVYTATYTEPEDERLALSLGADAFILKPAEPDQFLTRLRGILEAGWSRPPAEPEEPAGRDAEVLRRYTDTLIRKLGEKTRQLEATNDALTKDIAERKRAEESLRDSESFLRMAGRIGRLGAWAADARSLTLTWSDELSAIYEAAPGSVRTLQQAMSFVEPPFRTEFESAVRACIRQGVPFDLELRIVTGRGRRAWVRSIGEAVRDDDGRTLRLQGAQQDITPRKEGELALAESEERFRLLARATNDAIWDWDVETNRIWWSEGFETLFGVRTGEVVPTLDGWAARVHPDDREIVMASIRHALGSEEERWSAEYRFRLGGGGYASVFDHGQIIRDEEGAAIRMIGGMSDTTERKRLESHLLRTQRMENMGAVAGGMVHDLNNVLMPIMMATALLKEEERDSERLSMLESIEAGARRGAEMVRQVMAFG
ncbi:MAG: PAS domain-containing protein, partial [Gemmatimonadota bacterium]